MRDVHTQRKDHEDTERRWPRASPAQRPRKTPNLPAWYWTAGLCFLLNCLHICGQPCFLVWPELLHLTLHTQPPQGEGPPEHPRGPSSLSCFGRMSKSMMKCGRTQIICTVWFVVYSRSQLGVKFCQMPCRHLWTWSYDFCPRSVNMIDFLILNHPCNSGINPTGLWNIIFNAFLDSIALYFYFKILFWDFPGGPVVKNLLAIQGTPVQSLVGELRSHMPWGN